MKRSETPDRSGYTEAEAIESSTTEGAPRDQVGELSDLVGIGHFLAPEAHRHGGVDEAASAIREWAEDDVEMIAAAEAIARRRHEDDSAEILHRARILAVA